MCTTMYIITYALFKYFLNVISICYPQLECLLTAFTSVASLIKFRGFERMCRVENTKTFYCFFSPVFYQEAGFTICKHRTN